MAGKCLCRRARSVVAMVVIALAATEPTALADDLANLCRNPAFRNMHENECVVNGPGHQNRGDGGLLGVIGRVLGGLL